LVPGGTGADVVAERLAGAVRSAAGPGLAVRSVHVVAGTTENVDVDELLRTAMATLDEG
jgi:hypothetical protein